MILKSSDRKYGPIPGLSIAATEVEIFGKIAKLLLSKDLQKVFNYATLG